MSMNDMFFLSPDRNLQGIQWRQSGPWHIRGYLPQQSGQSPILDRLLPVKQVQELSRAETEVSCHAGEMATPLMGLLHSFLNRTCNCNIKVESN